MGLSHFSLCATDVRIVTPSIAFALSAQRDKRRHACLCCAGEISKQVLWSVQREGPVSVNSVHLWVVWRLCDTDENMRSIWTKSSTGVISDQHMGFHAWATIVPYWRLSNGNDVQSGWTDKKTNWEHYLKTVSVSLHLYPWEELFIQSYANTKLVLNGWTRSIQKSQFWEG